MLRKMLPQMSLHHLKVRLCPDWEWFVEETPTKVRIKFPSQQRELIAYALKKNTRLMEEERLLAIIMESKNTYRQASCEQILISVNVPIESERGNQVLTRE